MAPDGFGGCVNVTMLEKAIGFIPDNRIGCLFRSLLVKKGLVVVRLSERPRSPDNWSAYEG